MRKSKLEGNLKYMLILLVGFAVTTYPLIPKLYYRIKTSSAVHDFDAATKKIDRKEIDRRTRLAQIYNKALGPSKFADPYSEKKKKNTISEYTRTPEVKKKVGHTRIPKTNQDLPIYAGTSEEVLQKGVGHLEGTSLPAGDKGAHVVSTVHRGLPTVKLFTDPSKIKRGDVFYIHNIKRVLIYKVIDVSVVGPSDFDKVLAVEGGDYCTLLTCTPRMINSHRLLVHAERTERNSVAMEKDLVSQVTGKYRIYLVISLIATAILSWYYVRQRRRKKSNEIK